MVAHASASAPLAEGVRSLRALRETAEGCEACPLFARATQTVFSEGPRRAALFMVGEQPGDEEDRNGRVFVGPAGRMFDRLLADAGIERKAVYLTNAVKHFKWVPSPRGKKRLHSRPVASEVGACRGWLDAELRLVKPVALLCLGAVAAQGLRGNAFKVTERRGEIDRETPWAPLFMATWHPSAVLRAPDPEARAKTYAELLGDLRRIARAVERANRARA